MRVLAHITKDNFLCDFFMNSENDIHKQIASRWLGLISYSFILF